MMRKKKDQALKLSLKSPNLPSLLLLSLASPRSCYPGPMRETEGRNTTSQKYFTSKHCLQYTCDYYSADLNHLHVSQSH
ncbi:hypothetical protein BRARA_A02629 [Brassica rapa]|uniref:Uncharacterized protein n=1 Tax=Brassica campestris TaxID=3711 RepID=A0A398ASW9_BRACM|nr:hypothetical protein BRARA_A02629 [Brassica rapa]